MKHLSGLDATFLHLETPEMPMHVGSLNVLDLPKGYKGDFYEDAKNFMASRIHLADVFTRKLALMPFDMTNPVWVEDNDIDLDYHVRHITLPKPGTNRQLQQYVARLHSTLIDRSRPMWEFFIIDGLKSGQVALYTKVHHAGIDGQAGVEVGKAIFDLEATGRVVKPPRSRPRSSGYQLGMAELASAALRNTAQQYVKLFKMAPAIARAIGGLAKPDEKAAEKDAAAAPKKFNLFAPRTSLNVSITNQRTFAGRTISLAETKYIAKHFGVSLNDVVMATVSGALRHYLADNNELPAKPLVAGVPVSLREAGDQTANNQASMILVSLATDITDPVQRLKAINASSNSSKSTMNRFKAVILDDFPTFAAPWLVSGIASMVGRSGIVNLLPPAANVAISNVAGAPFPMYFAGALVTCYYPVSIASHGTALNVTVQSYNGRMDYGLIACRRAVPDITEIGDYMLAEHKLLMELTQKHPAAAGAAPAPVPPKTVEEPSDEAEVAAAPAAAKKRPAARKKAPVKVAAKKVAKPPVKAPLKAAAKKAKAAAAPKPPARKAAPAKRSSAPRAAAA
ncbi:MULTISPECIES: WS/DGAT/MGAT family O-acyltransferase [Variovorax]|jgi:diacylglycerol O-acyltransferase / wax synthase|uniref:WS/DGAT/MGAT family O-acyltransferase n=1 Tax=Variovorax TaxID=34072 RepID=UPI00086F0F27|nr:MULTISPECIES: wax ester/triacylglycerol synthase family O-acyltransferase [Variovorax]MBN8756857.1 wax ester/triacylglycerol synthase family O-acyltransferase [Variovorax sp.]ODU17106.1 MAG: acyltransferase [Variovorax sp. SCN 67-85]ODV21617.1 MAG: acyltransferase [Variovorax sp. SCN 67-20]OJZ14749.1 MAG: acyltransferase [Variovorax sp. 67-131]UKI07046.1 wax ester/triacylglycerol synthase family O-acyltransferase [Variovorax paradoxus]